MRAMPIVLCLMSPAVFGSKLETRIDRWLIEFTQTDGKVNRVGGYKTRQACEAVVPSSRLAAWLFGMYNAHCVEWDKTGTLFSSQDPVSFTRALGKWALEVTQPPLDGQVIWYIGYKSKEECEAAMPTSALAAWWLGMSDARCTDSTGGFLGSRNTDQSKN